ncbi:MAG: ComF family protein [Chloroflexota bacterium]
MFSLCADLALRLVNLLVPPKCANCHAAGKIMCDACREKIELVIAPYCRICGRPSFSRTVCRSCELNPPMVDLIRAATFYIPPVIDFVHQFKYHDQFGLQTPMSQILIDHWENLFGACRFDLVVPIPLARVRERTRGYNQAELLAAPLSHYLGVPTSKRTLVRVRETVPQAKLSGKDRKKNMKGSFRTRQIDSGIKRVLLVDDVYTTGATLDAAAEALKSEGVDFVAAYTFARTL